MTWFSIGIYSEILGTVNYKITAHKICKKLEKIQQIACKMP